MERPDQPEDDNAESTEPEGRGKAPIYPARSAAKLKIEIPASRWPGWWNLLAAQVLPFFAQSRTAFVWPEAEALLAESSWVHDVCDASFPGKWHIDSHHLSTARAQLRGKELTPLDEVLNGRTVTAWVLSSAIETRGDKTRVLAAAGAKRRAYRTFLGWTGDNKLCGSVGERAVSDVLEALRGTHLWIPRGARLGRITELQGRSIDVGGPLDAAGEWAKNPERLADGTIPFAVEVKNVRSMLYPYDHDVWDLIAKVADFPDVLPVIVARRFHPTTFKMFKQIGVLGTETRAQLFSPSIAPEVFKTITGTLGFKDAQAYVGGPLPGLMTFFSRTGPRLGQERLDLWREVAPIAANYKDLRDDTLDEGDRAELFKEFAGDLNAAGLYQGGWAAVFEEEEGSPWGDNDDYDEF